MSYAAIHDDAINAIREANQLATVTGIPHVVGYVRGLGWTCYDPRNPPGTTAPTIEPELLVFALGKVVLPLSENGFDVLLSATAAVA